MSFFPNRISIRDQTGAQAEITRYGQLVICERYDDILVRFEYTNSTYDVTTTTSGTGAASNANSLAVASTGSGVGACVFSTIRTTVYRPAHEMYGYFSAVYTTGAANTYQRAGLYDANDGFFFGYEGTSFGVSLRKGGSDTFIPKTSWNKDKCDGTGASGFNLDPTKDNQYKISFGWLGIAPITFQVYGGESRGWVICHVIDYTNSQTTPTINSPCSPARFEVSRTSGSGAITLSVGCMAAGSTQGADTRAGRRLFATSSPKTISAGVETLVLAMRNKTVFNGKNNKVAIEIVFLGASTDGTKNVRFSMYKNATISGGTWVDVDTTNAVIETNATATYSGGNLELVIPMLKSDTLALELSAGRIGIELFPGENLVISALSAASNDVVIAPRWEDHFA